jgi:hypothetical protein
MATPKDFIIDDFGKGIGQSPSVGYEDIRNLDITSAPGEASLNFGSSALTVPPTVTTLAFTTNTATDVCTVASTSGWYNGMAIQLNTVVTSTGISTGRVYWVGNITATTFKLYNNPNLDSARLVDITGSNGSGTLSSYTFAAPLDSTYSKTFVTSSYRPYMFILDTNGLAWWVNNFGGSLSTNLVYLGNDTTTSPGVSRGIVIHNQNLYVFRSGAFDYMQLSRLENTTVDFDTFGWNYTVDTIDDSPITPRPLYVARNGNLYYGASNNLGQIDTAGTLTENALDFPNDIVITSISELGANLMIGTKYGDIYPWDTVSTSFKLPLTVPENFIARMINTGNYLYIFAGYRGRIYRSNGYQVDSYFKVPDHLTGYKTPYFTWKTATLWRNQLYLSFSATQNDGTAINTLGGVWAIDLINKSFRYALQLSYGAYTGVANCIIPHVLADTPPGLGLYVAWTNSSTYGVDVTTSSFPTGYKGYMISPLYHVGTTNDTKTYNEIEISFTRPLATSEGCKVYSRKNNSDAFVLIGTFDYATYGAVTTINAPCNIIDAAMLQLKLEFTNPSTSTVSFREIRLR